MLRVVVLPVELVTNPSAAALSCTPKMLVVSACIVGSPPCCAPSVGWLSRHPPESQRPASVEHSNTSHALCHRCESFKLPEKALLRCGTEQRTGKRSTRQIVQERFNKKGHAYCTYRGSTKLCAAPHVVPAPRHVTNIPSSPDNNVQFIQQ